MSNTKEWWRDTTDLVWKEFFRSERDGPSWPNWSNVTPKVIDACKRIFSERFITEDQQIIRAFYDRHWGDGIFAIEEYAKNHAIPVNACWSAIRKARRELMIELEIIERERRNGNGYERE